MFHLAYTTSKNTLHYYGFFKNVDNARNMGKKLVKTGKAVKFQISKG